MTLDERLRYAEALVSEAKKILREDWNKYSDVQRTMLDLEEARQSLDTLIHKQNTGALK